MPTARPARSVPVDRLQELAYELRRDSVERGATIPSSWVEETAQDLRSGKSLGWVLDDGGAGGLALLSLREHRAYGHVHVEPGDGELERAGELLGALVGNLPPVVARLDVGVTGIPLDREAPFAAQVAATPGFTVILRQAMDCPTAPYRLTDADPWGPGLRRLPAREIPSAALAALDWAAFQGTPDASFVSETPADDERSLREILDGRLGRFLDEASAAVVNAEDHLVGAILTAEETPRRVVFLDLVVHPAHRRTGLGRRMIVWGLRAAAALGHDTARLWVTESNLPARRLYESVGFVPGARIAIYRWERGGPAPQAQFSR